MSARMETRPPNIEGKGEIRQRELVKNALRMRPDRIILGECRGEEAFDMLQAMNTGHEGSMATIHANNSARRDLAPRADDRHGRPADDDRLDPRPDRRRHPHDRAAVSACPTASAASPPSPRSPAWKATSSRCRKSSNTCAPAPADDGTVRAISRRPACARASSPISIATGIKIPGSYFDPSKPL